MGVGDFLRPWQVWCLDPRYRSEGRHERLPLAPGPAVASGVRDGGGTADGAAGWRAPHPHRAAAGFRAVMRHHPPRGGLCQHRFVRIHVPHGRAEGTPAVGPLQTTTTATTATTLVK